MITVQFYRNATWLGPKEMPAAPNAGQQVYLHSNAETITGTIETIEWTETKEGFVYAKARLK